MKNVKAAILMRIKGQSVSTEVSEMTKKLTRKNTRVRMKRHIRQNRDKGSSYY